MSKIKIFAVYKAVVEKHVEVGEFDTWEEDAAAVAKLPKPVLTTEDGSYHLEKIWKQDPECEDYYDTGHYACGVCALCGQGIVDGACGEACSEELHIQGSGGWVNTKHGHRQWCSQECRDKDPEDFEREGYVRPEED